MLLLLMMIVMILIQVVEEEAEEVAGAAAMVVAMPAWKTLPPHLPCPWNCCPTPDPNRSPQHGASFAPIRHSSTTTLLHTTGSPAPCLHPTPGLPQRLGFGCLAGVRGQRRSTLRAVAIPAGGRQEGRAYPTVSVGGAGGAGDLRCDLDNEHHHHHHHHHHHYHGHGHDK